MFLSELIHLFIFQDVTLEKEKGKVFHAFFFGVFYFRNWKMTWRVISLATSSNSWWPLWLPRLCLMQNSWRNPWGYEPNRSHFCPRFDYVIKNNDLLPVHTWEMHVNRIDLDVILMLCYLSGRTVLKWGTVVEPWAHMFLGWKDIVIS